MRKLLALLCGLILVSFKQSNESARQLSLSFTSKVLENGKYITVNGEVYFKKNGGVLTTHLVKPFENITIVNARGEMKIYDPAANSVVQNNSAFNSTESSYFWHFLNGSYNDLGFSKLGYTVGSTKVEDGLIITHWMPKIESNTPIADIELVHNKTLPIYVCFRDSRNKLLGKIYFSGYRLVGDVNLPAKITEIMYREKKDSTITTKVYSNPKINNNVDQKFLDYKIPANAKVVLAK